jgi:hypothetical protein
MFCFNGGSFPESAMPYVELVAASNFSFLHGASHPGELVLQAAALGLGGMGICDRNSFVGVVRGLISAREVWKENPFFHYLVGVWLVFTDGTPDIVAYPHRHQAGCHRVTRGAVPADVKAWWYRVDSIRLRLGRKQPQLPVHVALRGPTEPWPTTQPKLDI